MTEATFKPNHLDPLGKGIPFAPALLLRASQHMEERAVTYDQPEGERSMEKVVKAFNVITGQELTESEGWLFMAVLKMVRGQAAVTPHRDSCEDLIAYSALYAEARISGR